ncbi:MAG TPA: FliA/WhiG family RNA polymerase sigma factor [Phycisphaerae bacterium]|nr:FliA/WhiG family RNA polymerase sigma factor [Phycisphaerae bacterium]HPS53231.1 FliA/WhiG family RNA polymerase sigma factor [Phycisphaerae bacterium]
MKKTRKSTMEEVQQWWNSFKKCGDDDSRNKLLEHYLPIVRYTADRLRTKLPEEVDVDDLVSSGIFGLLDAINAFDVKRGVKFETYCAQRIRGAILDELRALDWVPRLVRSRTHKVNEASGSLEAQLGRKPEHAELAKALKISQKEFTRLCRDSEAVNVVSLSTKWFETDSNKDVTKADMIEDKNSDNPLEMSQRRDLKELLTRGLSRAERLIVILYYFEEMTMKEIGETLDLSESRVSQMHSAIMERMREQLAVRKMDLQYV